MYTEQQYYIDASIVLLMLFLVYLVYDKTALNEFFNKDASGIPCSPENYYNKTLTDEFEKEFKCTKGMKNWRQCCIELKRKMEKTNLPDDELCYNRCLEAAQRDYDSAKKSNSNDR